MAQQWIEKLEEEVLLLLVVLLIYEVLVKHVDKCYLSVLGVCLIASLVKLSSIHVGILQL